MGLGISLLQIGNALAITERDFERVKRHMDRTSYPMGGRSSRRQLDASAAP